MEKKSEKQPSDILILSTDLGFSETYYENTWNTNKENYQTQEIKSDDVSFELSKEVLFPYYGMYIIILINIFIQLDIDYSNVNLKKLKMNTPSTTSMTQSKNRPNTSFHFNFNNFLTINNLKNVNNTLLNSRKLPTNPKEKLSYSQMLLIK